MLVFKPQKLFWSTLRALGALYLARERQKIKSIDCFSVRCTAVITDRHTRRRKSGGWEWGRVEYLKKGEENKKRGWGVGGEKNIESKNKQGGRRKRNSTLGPRQLTRALRKRCGLDPPPSGTRRCKGLKVFASCVQVQFIGAFDASTECWTELAAGCFPPFAASL